MHHDPHGKISDSLIPLTPLDLGRCKTVSDIAAGLKSCAFGGANFGQAADTLTEWFQSEHTPDVVYDGEEDSPVHQLLKAWREEGYIRGIWTSPEYGARELTEWNRVLVVGNYMERFARRIYDRCEQMLFINSHGQCQPGQVRDGYFPDVVFSDPSLILPMLNAVILERLSGIRVTVRELMEVLTTYGGIAPDVAHGAETLWQMQTDPDCGIFVTLSGAMTAAQMSLVTCDTIERLHPRYLASTGALMCHGIVPGMGLKHYQYDPRHSDEELAAEDLNRITTILEPETNFDQIENVVRAVLADPIFNGHAPVPPSIFHALIGKYLAETYPQHRAILRSAWQQSVPVVVPAFVDSEIGNDVAVENLRRVKQDKPRLIIDEEQDSLLLLKLASDCKRLGIFSVGGGVPRNNTQNTAPLSEIVQHRVDPDQRVVVFNYGCRIDPAPGHTGTMGSATYGEMISWRKADPHGHFSEIRTDATIVWPFMMKYVMECQDAGRT